MTYTVEVTREDDAWIAQVVDLPGAHTFARNLTQLDAAVVEVIELVADLPEDGPRPEIKYAYVGVPEVVVAAARIGERRQDLEQQQQLLLMDALLSAQQLADAGYSVRDISGVLQMSPGRVSQILNPVASQAKKSSSVRSTARGT